jgi:hypothetical protein
MKQKVVIFGNSLVVSSIGASLQACPNLEVLPAIPAMPDVEGSLSAAHPDVVIFDLATAQPDFAINLWKKHPHLLLIGVDLVKGQALVLSGQPTRVLTAGDLLQVIESHAGDGPRPPGRPRQARKPKTTPV